MRITEVDDEGSVPELRVANLGDLPLLLLDGEQTTEDGWRQRDSPGSRSQPYPARTSVLAIREDCAASNALCFAFSAISVSSSE